MLVYFSMYFIGGCCLYTHVDVMLYADRALCSRLHVNSTGSQWAGKRPFSKKHDVLDCLIFVRYESQHSAGLGFFYGSFLSFFNPEIFLFENAHSWLFRCLYIWLNWLNIANTKKSTEIHYMTTYLKYNLN